MSKSSTSTFLNLNPPVCCRVPSHGPPPLPLLCFDSMPSAIKQQVIICNTGPTAEHSDWVGSTTVLHLALLPARSLVSSFRSCVGRNATAASSFFYCAVFPIGYTCMNNYVKIDYVHNPSMVVHLELTWRGRCSYYFFYVLIGTLLTN